MRRRRTLIVLLLAVASGGLAGYSALQLMQQSQVQIIQPQERDDAVQIVVAARDIGVGERLAEEDVMLVEWPGDIVPEGLARTKAEVIGRGTLQPLVRHEPLLDRKLADRSGGFGVPILIDEGKRALTIRVNQEVAVAGFYQPNMRADILLTTTPPGASEPETRIVKQNVVLLAADAMTERDAEGKPVNYTLATLHVTPEDAEDIVLMQELGEIRLVLRNTLDLEEIRTRGARKTRMYADLGGGGGGAPRRVVTTAPAPTTDASGSGFVNIITSTGVKRVRW